jgi:hypothetical protein
MAALVAQSLMSSYAVVSDMKLDSFSRPNACNSASSCTSPVLFSSRPANGRKSSILRSRRGRALLLGKKSIGSSSNSVSWGRCSPRPGEAFAKGTDDSFSPAEMTHEDALKLLGVGEGASFDEILGAKRKLVDGSGGDQERITQVNSHFYLSRYSATVLV